jgi:predicted RNA polymerase sigma factor
VSGHERIENLLRECAPQVLAALVRRSGQFDACEDAVQEALLAAALQWPTARVPDRPRSWLLTVASPEGVTDYVDGDLRDPTGSCMKRPGRRDLVRSKAASTSYRCCGRS